MSRSSAEDRLAAERDGEVRLADAGWPEQKHVLAVVDPARRGQIADLLRVDRGLRLEVEARELLDCREVRGFSSAAAGPAPSRTARPPAPPPSTPADRAEPPAAGCAG